MRSVALLGGSIPFREAVTARLIDSGWRIADADEASVVVVFCSDDEAWSELQRCSGSDRLGCVAVLLALEPELYRRALSMGAGVVYHDTSTEIIAQVIESAAHGEALVPMEIARWLAHDAARSPVRDAHELTDLERSLLRGIVDGETIGTLSDRLHYSERTIRRRLQAAYLKLGVDDRAAAVRRIERERLLD